MNINIEGKPLKVILAYCFGQKLLEEIGLDKLVETNLLNRAEVSDGVCHSHDFCDANMVLNDVYDDFGIADDFDPASQDDADLWNEVWNIAKRYNFFVEINE